MLDSVYKWQNSKQPWMILSFTMIFLVFLAHNVFQNYLFMNPCEQCVYIRFAMIVLAIAGLIALVFKSSGFKIIAYSLAFYACFIGINYCITLDIIHTAVNSNNPFAKAPPCKMNPIFPFSLPLDELFPSLFKPTGLCGYDAPMVAKSENLSPIQEFFVGTSANNFKDGFYSNGWYLIPSLKFMNMAIACLISFLVSFLVLFVMFLTYFKNHILNGVFVIIVTFILVMV